MAEFEFETEIESATLTVQFDYTPPDAGVMYYPDGTGQPPSPAEIDGVGIYWENEVWENGKKKTVRLDVTELIEQLGLAESIDEKCYEYAEKHAQ